MIGWNREARRQSLALLVLLHVFSCASRSIWTQDNEDIAQLGRESFFSTRLYEPFQLQIDEEACAEPVYCSHTVEMQRRIRMWQHESLECSSMKFLVYEPPSEDHGIGSMIQIIGHVFRQAICLGRRLYLLPSAFEKRTLSRWKHPACSNESSTIECYFERISSCTLSDEEILSAPTSSNGYGINAYPLRNARVLRLIGLPAEGPW